MSTGYEEAARFVHENSKEVRGVRVMTQTGYLDYMESQHHISPDTVKAMTTAERALISGAISVGTEDLITAINKAKEAGEDPTEVSSSVRISRPNGQLKVDIDAETNPSNPKTGERYTKHGTVSVSARQKTLIDPDVAHQTQERIAKVLANS